jgi:four helix bundle protein
MEIESTIKKTEKKRVYDLEERLINFSCLIIEIAEKLPNTPAGKHLGGQLLRSGTSPALNYGEAQAAESPNNFIHKMKVCLKELRETNICLIIISKRKMIMEFELAEKTLAESKELVAIFTTSVKTVQSNNS